MLHDLNESYTQEINDKLSTVAAIKQSLTEALADGYVLMEQFHNQSRKLAQKNQPVYSIWEQLQKYIAENKTCIDLVRLQRIDEEFASIGAQVRKIQEESAKTKKKICDL